MGGVADRLGALREREYRLLFSATLTTSLGNAIGTIALAFAVLDVAGATALGVVLGARQVVSTAVLVLGGVLSDRRRRNRILVMASVMQGAAQAVLAVAVLTGSATVALFVAAGAVWGAGDGFVVPAEVGLVPQSVSPERLQEANALQGLSRSGVRVLGPAIGGVLVVALNPGWALAADAASFALCAWLLGRMCIPPRAAAAAPHYLAELRAGWHEFTSRTWLWSTVLLFGVGNVFMMFAQVLGPAIAEQRLGGAGAWAAIVSAGGVGAIAGGLLALRHRPPRPLIACILWPLTVVPEFAALATGAPTAVIAAGALVAGAGLAVHTTLWFTIFQREVPEHAQSRVSAYDAFGSLVLSPLGAALAGPAAAALGTGDALWLAAAAILISNLSMLLIPAAWRIRAPAPALAGQTP